MAELKIRVSAAADPSLRTVFKPIEEAAARAQQAAKRSADGHTKAARDTAAAGDRGAAAQAKAADKTAASHARAVAKIERELAKLAAAEQRAAARGAEAHARAEQRKTQMAMREFDRRLQAAKRAHDAEEREIMRTAARAQQAAAKTSAAHAQAQRSSRARDVEAARDGLRKSMQAAGYVGRELAQGLGVDFSIGGATQRNVELERRSSLLSLQSKREGSTEQLTADEVSARIREAATAGGFSNLDAAEGVSQFAAKTGDVGSALRLMKELGPLAQATGTSLDDMVSAAGEVSNALGDMKGEEKIKAIADAMRAFTAQGMEGSVEISDMATQAAKLGAAAGMFGGDRGKTLGTLGAILQVARAKGGATSADEAGTAVSGMVNTLKTKARRGRFAEAGVEIEDPTTGLLKDPQAIIEDSIVAADTDTSKFKSMWANVSGARTVEGFRSSYLEARAKAKEGGASDKEAKRAGLTAIRSTFDTFAGASLSPEKVEAMMAERLQNSDVKAQQFQNRLDEIGARAGEKLLPALERLAPVILQVVDAFAGTVAWAAENPGKAITAAIVTSIARARLAEALEGILSGAAGGRGGAGGGAGNAVGGALGVVAAGAGGFMAGKAIAEQAGDERDRADAAIRERSAEWENARSAVAMKMKTGQLLSGEDAEALLGAKRGLEDALRGAEESQSAGRAVGGGLSAALSFVSAGSAGTSAERQGLDAAAARQADVLKAQLEAVNATMLSVLAATRDKGVIVKNMPSVLVEQVGRTTDFVGGFFGMGGGR